MMLPDRRRNERIWQRFVLAPRSALLRYGVAVLLACGSLAIVRGLHGVQAADLSSLAFASVVLSAIYGGVGPALLDTAISAVGIDYLFAEPLYQVFDSWSSLFRVVIFGTVGYLIADIVASLREAYGKLHFEHRQTEQAKRAREDVLAMVSHDLRSPLSAVLTSAEYLRRATQHGELHDVAAGMERSGRQMGRLIDDLLDAVRMENGQFKIEPARHDLTAIVHDAQQGVLAAAGAKGVRLVTRMPNPIEIDCDRNRILQAVSNLLDNAVKFSPEGASVEVALREVPGGVTIEVKDFGLGIAEDALPHIFERYWQAKGTAHRGTGLGLFITKNIIEAHCGRIEVRSRAGEGSVFRIHLPR